MATFTQTPHAEISSGDHHHLRPHTARGQRVRECLTRLIRRRDGRLVRVKSDDRRILPRAALQVAYHQDQVVGLHLKLRSRVSRRRQRQDEIHPTTAPGAPAALRATSRPLLSRNSSTSAGVPVTSILNVPASVRYHEVIHIRATLQRATDGGIHPHRPMPLAPPAPLGSSIARSPPTLGTRRSGATIENGR